MSGSTPALRGTAAAGGMPQARTKRFHFVVAGYDSCPYFHKASRLAAALALLYPDAVEHVEKNFPTRDEYRAWLPQYKEEHFASDARAQAHTSSPFVTLNGAFLGGCDDTIAFGKKTFGAGAAGWTLAADGKGSANGAPALVDDGYRPGHAYDYDLVVVGGGSGGLACAKEAALLGARVALLDYVKPSPQGTAWGLGGTCVNVGCIPKKLCHQAALLGEVIQTDLKAFGWGADTTATSPTHSWETLRENVQMYIKSLNFGYRVQLRDKAVTYLNKHGRFVDAHTLEVVDKKGTTSTLTAARFVVAVGGRPQPLNCPGGELAITSDDLFSLPEAPGKTCVVGAGYVSLECAGFLRAMGMDVTVLVRSILLRGFDRECCEKIGDYMVEHSGVKLLREVVPVAVERVDGDGDGDGGKPRLRVTFSNGESDVFDTVMSARGRYADLRALNVEALGLAMDKGSGKLLCTHEQTSVPHVYAVGDVLHDKPELTPVAIQAGILLARRLFGGITEQMDYVNIATTVFTPLEYGCVGLSEEQAEATLGAGEFEVFHSSFLPLEWSIVPERTAAHGGGFAKALVRKTDDKVVGLHYLGPNAGEVIQGYAVAVKAGITHAQLVGTVGIHPTTAEELTMLQISKSSGASAKKAGC